MSKVNGNRLRTFDDVVDALGGVKETAKIAKRSASLVCQWRVKFGAFPPEHYLNISKALVAKGYGAPLHLFTFEPPSE